jgi:hypothetical protein
MRKARSFLLLTAPLTLIAVGCGASGNTTATLQRISPDRAYNDTPIPVQLFGKSFHPPVQVDTYSASADLAPSPFQVSLDPLRPAAGRGSVAAITPSWKDHGEIDATLPAGLPAGTYSVSLRDAAGNTIASLATFTSLGPDMDAPHIEFLEPPAGTAFAVGKNVTVKVHVDDGAGQLGLVEWSTDPPTGSPPMPCWPDPAGLCEFVITPQAGPDVVDPIDILVHATDTLNNQATASRRVQVAWTPTITKIDPLEAPTTGGTTITVSGYSFVPNLSQIIVDGVSIGGMILEDGSISGTSLAHIPGDAPVFVTNGGSKSDTFSITFIPPPVLKLIDPPRAVVDGPTVTIRISGSNFRSVTEFFWIQGATNTLFSPVAPDNFGPVPPYERLLSPTQVELTLPTNRTGTFSISAHDPVSLDSVLLDAFTLDPAPAP